MNQLYRLNQETGAFLMISQWVGRLWEAPIAFEKLDVVFDGEYYWSLNGQKKFYTKEDAFDFVRDNIMNYYAVNLENGSYTKVPSLAPIRNFKIIKTKYKLKFFSDVKNQVEPIKLKMLQDLSWPELQAKYEIITERPYLKHVIQTVGNKTIGGSGVALHPISQVPVEKHVDFTNVRIWE